jgi:hypothetical protein
VKEKLEQALVEIIQKTQDGVSSGIDFLTAQIPDVVHQLLVYKMAEAGIMLALLSAFLGTIAYMNYRQWKWFVGTKDEFIDHPELMFNLFQLFLIIPALMWFKYLKTVLMIWLAPKIYLIEYASNLAK